MGRDSADISLGAKGARIGHNQDGDGTPGGGAWHATVPFVQPPEGPVSITPESGGREAEKGQKRNARLPGGLRGCSMTPLEWVKTQYRRVEKYLHLVTRLTLGERLDLRPPHAGNSTDNAR